MFKGPSRDSVMQGVGPFFSTINGSAGFVFSGAPITAPRLTFDSLDVGTGQQLLFYVAEDFDAPTAPVDVKWIDIGCFYRPGTARLQGVASGSFVFLTKSMAPTELISIRDPRNPGTQLAERRWRITRVPVAADPDNAHPFGTPAPVGIPRVSFEDKAVGDILTVYTRFVALDQDEDPVVAAGKSYNLGVAFGGFARG